MKPTLTLLFSLTLAFLTACGPSGIAKDEMEKFSGTPTPTITPLPEQTPIPAKDSVTVDTSLDGPILTVNNEPKKTLDCNKYNLVAINATSGVITLKGICQKVTVNGDNNQIAADASMSFVFNGTGNAVTHSRFANGKQPVVTQNQSGNTVEFVSVDDMKLRSNANTTKKK